MTVSVTLIHKLQCTAFNSQHSYLTEQQPRNAVQCLILKFSHFFQDFAIIQTSLLRGHTRLSGEHDANINIQSYSCQWTGYGW